MFTRYFEEFLMQSKQYTSNTFIVSLLLIDFLKTSKLCNADL